MNAIKLSDHFDYKRLLRYCLPSIIMMLFTSIYYIVDGFFVSNYAGKTPFAAVNLIMPLLLVLGCIGFMFGTGGGALIAKPWASADPTRQTRYSLSSSSCRRPAAWCLRRSDFSCCAPWQGSWVRRASFWSRALSTAV